MKNGTPPLEPEDTEPILASPAEDALAGIEMHLPASKALETLRGTHPDYFIGQLARAVLRLVREVASAGVDPEPPAIMARAADSRRFTGEESMRRLGRYVANAYTNAPLATDPGYYRDLLERADYRRTARTTAIRIAQLVQEADGDELPQLIAEVLTAFLAHPGHRLKASEQPTPIRRNTTEGAA